MNNTNSKNQQFFVQKNIQKSDSISKMTDIYNIPNHPISNSDNNFYSFVMNDVQNTTFQNNQFDNEENKKNIFYNTKNNFIDKKFLQASSINNSNIILNKSNNNQMVNKSHEYNNNSYLQQYLSDNTQNNPSYINFIERAPVEEPEINQSLNIQEGNELNFIEDNRIITRSNILNNNSNRESQSNASMDKKIPDFKQNQQNTENKIFKKKEIFLVEGNRIDRNKINFNQSLLDTIQNFSNRQIETEENIIENYGIDKIFEDINSTQNNNSITNYFKENNNKSLNINNNIHNQTNPGFNKNYIGMKQLQNNLNFNFNKNSNSFNIKDKIYYDNKIINENKNI